jgi:superfamily II DNA/RNA helicase
MTFIEFFFLQYDIQKSIMDCKSLKKLITQNKREVKKAQKALDKAMKDYEKCKKKEDGAKAAKKKAKKTTVAQKRANCKKDGKVYDTKTKECRQKKTRKKKDTLKRDTQSTSKNKKKSKREPGFFNAWAPLHPNIATSDWRYGVYGEPKDALVNKFIKDTGKITGDILYIGSDYESRQEYGIVVVDLDYDKTKKKKFINTEIFYYVNPNMMDDEVIINELTGEPKDLTDFRRPNNECSNNRPCNALDRGLSEQAVKEYIKWADSFF